MREVDVAVIGAGTAGMSAYRAARKRADRLVLIEGGPYGTTCARVGCMPSKLLIAAAEAAGAVREAPGFGVHSGTLRIDGAEVMDRVRRERDRFVGFVLEAVEGFDPAHRLAGSARFEDPRTLRLDTGERVRAERIVIATGSRPVRPKAFEAAGDRLIVNDDVFDPMPAAATAPPAASGSTGSSASSVSATDSPSPSPTTPPGPRSGIQSSTGCSARSARTGQVAPLESYQTVLNYIRTTRTTTGLRLRAHLVRKQYKKGTTIPDRVMRDLPITKDSALPRWNYMLNPS